MKKKPPKTIVEDGVEIRYENKRIYIRVDMNKRQLLSLGNFSPAEALLVVEDF